MYLSDDWAEFETPAGLFRARIERDDNMGTPWDEHDGHGPVSDWTSRNKRPGELVLNSDRGSRRYYDFQAAMKQARAEGWQTAPYDVPTETAGQRAYRAVMADFNRLRAWCRDDWCWVGVIVEKVETCPACAHTRPVEAASLWGLESDQTEYLAETARELAAELSVGEAYPKTAA